MQHLWEFIHQLFDPQSIIKHGGVFLLLFVIFAETGLFFGFFLPGDSLLFIAGVLSASTEDSIAAGGKHVFGMEIYILLPAILLAAVLGNFVGYIFGWRAGTLLMHRKDSLFFKKRYIVAASDFYHERGGLALILGRFLPIIRTFVPIIAGIVKLEFRKFAFYNITGGFLWVSIITLAGYFLGKRYKGIGQHIDLIVIGLIVISIIPVMITFFRNHSKNKAENKQT